MASNSQLSVWLKIWYQPRVSTQALIDSGRGHGAALTIAVLFGAVQSLRFYISGMQGGGVLVLGGAAGAVGLFLFGWLLRNFGRWFKAEASVRAVRTVLGIGLLPWTLVFLGMAGVVASGRGVAGFEWLMFSVFFAVFIYGYVILLLGLSTALKISVLKTFLCLVVTFLVSLFPLTLLGQIIFGAPGAVP